MTRKLLPVVLLSSFASVFRMLPTGMAVSIPLWALQPVEPLQSKSGEHLSTAPVAFWASQPVEPGETALVFGDGFTGCTSVRVGRLPDGPPGAPLGGPPGSPHSGTYAARRIAALYRSIYQHGWTVRPLQVSPRAVKFELPPAAHPGVFLAVLDTPAGAASVWLNRPQILWAQGDEGPASTPGGSLRVVGNCLAVPGGKPLLRLEGGGKAVTLVPAHAGAFTLGATLPASMAPGTYWLYAYSGTGGSAGWSAPIELQVSRHPTASTVTVTLANGPESEMEDRTVAIQTAINGVAAKGGGTVLIPRGRYLLSDGLRLPPGATLKGEGMGLTALCWKDTATPPEALLRGSGHFGVEDLTLYATNYRHGIISDQTGPAAGHVRLLRVRLRLDPYRGHITPEDVDKRFVESLKLSTGGGDSIRLGGPAVEVAGCDVYGAGRCLYLSRCSGASIHDNLFYNGRWGWYCISGSNGVLFERNTIQGGDLMSTGGGLNCLDGSMVSQNVYYADNTLRNMFGWDREAMTTDAGGGAYYGPVDSTSGTEITLPADGKWNGRDWTGAGVFILDGRGQGQYRQIVKAQSRTVEVDRPWLIAPDKTSIITITMLQRNYLFIRNHFEDAGVAIQMYGTSIGAIAYGNTSARTGGFHNFGMNYDGVQPSWFVQWLHNEITEGNVYGGGHDQSVSIGEAHLGVYALPPGVTPQAPITLCAVMRGNHLFNNAHLAVGGSDPPNSGMTYPYVQEVVVEGNRVENAAVGLRIARASAGVLSRNNTFIHCLIGSVDDVELERLAAARRAVLYRLPGPLLHLTFTTQQGKIFTDSAGHGFNARCEGVCTVTPGAPGGSAVNLDGNSYLEVAHPELLSMESLTLGVWVKTDHLKGRWGFLSKRGSSSPTPFVLGEEDGSVAFEATDVNEKWSFNFRSPPVLTPGEWHHVAAVVQAGQGVTLYVDGKAVAHKDNPLARMQNSDALLIGKEAWGGDPPNANHAALFKGSLADVQVWARAFTPEEVAKMAAR